MKFKLTEDLDDKFRNFKIDVHYDKLPITYYGETHDYSYYEPPDTDEYEDDVEWDYTIDWTDFAETVRDCLTEDESHLNEIFEELGFKKVNEVTDDEFNEQINSEEMDEYIYNHADELMDRYETQFQDFYEESAAEDASDYYSENYEEMNEPDWDMMPGGHDDWYDDGDI